MVSTDDYEAVINGLNRIIRQYLNAGASQQYQPDSNPDMADHLIADALTRASKLRFLRDKFEETVSGAIMDKYRDGTANVPPDPRT